MKKIYLLLIGIVVLSLQNYSQTVTDFEGNVYKTVKIGNQVWMAQNLNTTHYANGDTIGTTYRPIIDISSDTTPKYQWAYRGSDSIAAIYGRLYTWYTATDNRNICPVGLHLPSDEEWKELETFIGMPKGIVDSLHERGTDQGNQLKDTGNAYWFVNNTGATNSVGFTALPGGYWVNNNGFNGIGTFALFWSSTDSNSSEAYFRYLYCFYDGVGRYIRSKDWGFSIRCMMAVNDGVEEINQLNKILLYPNPAKENFTISYNVNTKGSIYLTLQNALGMQVIEKVFNNNSQGREIIDVSGLQAGIYFYQLRSDETSLKSGKIIIIK